MIWELLLSFLLGFAPLAGFGFASGPSLTPF